MTPNTAQEMSPLMQSADQALQRLDLLLGDLRLTRSESIRLTDGLKQFAQSLQTSITEADRTTNSFRDEIRRLKEEVDKLTKELAAQNALPKRV